MRTSLFIQFVKALWPKLSLYVKEREKPKNRTYLFKDMLTKVYSADQKWEGTSANTSYVAADIVAMDSPLPIKKRGSLSTSNGKLPKMGMEKVMQETDINTINIMTAHFTLETNPDQKADEKNRILQKLLNDADACAIGIDEKTEDVFLKGLSYGYVLVEDEDNVGTGLRIDYGYFKSNQFGVTTEGSISKEDIEKVFDKAETDGNTIITIMLSKARCNALRKERWARELVADSQGKIYSEDSNLPVPSQTNFEAAFEEEFGAKLNIVNRTILYEKNGHSYSAKPWNTNKLVFLCDDNVGSLVWGTLAEATNQVPGVIYTTVDQHKLISKYSVSDPSLREITKGQALVLPVIENVDQIYTLDVSEAVEGDPDAEKDDPEDIYVTLNGKKYLKADVAAELTKLGVPASATDSDEEILIKVNSLSQAKERKLFNALTEVTDDSTGDGGDDDGGNTGDTGDTGNDNP